MTKEVDICSLDFLVGTIATAYKGSITSLVVKDFCITRQNRKTIFKGTFLSIPEGSYRLSLMCGGSEIENAEIQAGNFEVKVDSSSIKGAKNLQLDLVQNGRHIGTILLKKETIGGFYSSVLELSQELEGINFKLLYDSLKERKGVQKKAESIISSIVSTKKDWRELSEKINSFLRDLFWYDRETFHLWYTVLCRFAVRACEQVDTMAGDKTISNCLSLIELPLEKETDEEQLKLLLNTWKQEIKDASIDLALRYNHTLRILRIINERLPSADINILIKMLLLALKKRIDATPFINNTVIGGLKNSLDESNNSVLLDFSEKKKDEIMQTIELVETLFDSQADISEILKKIKWIDTGFFDDVKMINTLFDVIGKNITKIEPHKLSASLIEVLLMLNRLSPDAYKSSILLLSRLIKKLIYSDMIETCEILLGLVEERDDSPRDRIILNEDIALEILRAENITILKKYKVILMQILIPPPKISGFSEETWAEISNPIHLRRISGFINIIKLDFNKFHDVLIHLICNLYVSGVFIPDDKLFQREISKYLNSNPVSDNYFLHYMLLKKLPTFFNDVGASGRIRDLTTDIDSWGNDPVIYFLRKQVHVNASNHNIDLVENIIKAWVFNKPDYLKGVIPEEIFGNMNTGLLKEYSLAIKPLFDSLGLLNGEKIYFKEILHLTEDDIESHLHIIKTTDEIRTKVSILCRVYIDIVKKYALIDIESEKQEDIQSRIFKNIDDLKRLKDTFTSIEKTSPEESFYFKRHIAFGIPSVIGTYHEPKFDAFGETLRIEERLRVQMENMIVDIQNKEKDFSMDNIKRWIYYLEAINGIFRLHSLENFQIDELITILKTDKLHLSQVIDMLRIWQKELTWMVESFYRLFHNPLIDILKKYPSDELSENLKNLNPGDSDFYNKAADNIIRGMLGSIVGFEELDRMLNSLIKCLMYHVESESDEEVSLSGKEDKTEDYFIINELSRENAMRLAPFIGSKAKNLVYLNADNLLVPHGVVLSAKWTKDYSEYIKSDHFRSILINAIKDLEKKTGLGFGDNKRPLFISVRSGSYVSMPGILSSILYCGLNNDTMEALINNTGNPWLPWDSYRRFIEHYSEVVLAIDLAVYDNVMKEIIGKYGVENLQGLRAGGVEEIVHSYLEILSGKDLYIPVDVYEQLKESVKAIYSSWFNNKASQFRKAMNVSEHWGTSVTLMQMVQGNNKGAGASVFFTRKPFSLEKRIYGETREMATGDDLVYGKSLNRPIAKGQALDGVISLEETDNELFQMHEEIARKVEYAMGGLPQEIEAAYAEVSDGRRAISVLQTKRMEFSRGATRSFHDLCKMESSMIGRGIGVHGGALNGIVTFSDSLDYIKNLKIRFKQPIILLRKETSTDDVTLMPEISGIITSTGGATSHAAILSQKFDLTAVVGCSDMIIKSDKSGEQFAVIGDYNLKEGMPLGLDGSTGLIYSGICMLTVKENYY